MDYVELNKLFFKGEINTYKLVDRGMKPSSVDSLHSGNGFKTSSCTEAVTYHRL